MESQQLKELEEAHEQPRVVTTQFDTDPHFSKPSLTYPPPAKLILSASEIQETICTLGVKKANFPIDKSIVLGIYAGFFITLAAIVSLSCSSGISTSLLAQIPSLPKFVLGLVFPIGLLLIILFGGELFTGNAMVMVTALLCGKISLLQLGRNWFVVYFSNLVGCLMSVYLFAYLTDSFSEDVMRRSVVSLAEKKVHLSWLAAFLRAIPANALVCLGVYLGLAAKDMCGKILAISFPIFAFVASGFEHSIANMAFIPIGMLYGASVTVEEFIVFNLIPVSLGNIVGGSLLVAGGSHYLLARESSIS